MGRIFEQSKLWVDRLVVDDSSVFVEIGSDRGEGSTIWFAGEALSKGCKLITVDIDVTVAQRLKDQPHESRKYNNINFDTAQGSIWAKEIFPAYHQTVSCLYLDNFDYDWDVDNLDQNNSMRQLIAEQKILYRRLGYEMSNWNCQREHLAQMQSLLPLMNKSSVIICDDTYEWNDCWVGKSGPAVVLASLYGYDIVYKDHTGVILARNL